MNPALVLIGACILVTMVLQRSASSSVEAWTWVAPCSACSFFLACSCVHSDWDDRLPFT